MPLLFERVIITGGSSGIGQALVKGLQPHVGKIWAVARRVEALPVNVEPIKADLTNAESLAALANIVRAIKPDLLINAAGAGECVGFEAITEEVWGKTFELMLTAPRVLTLAALPAMQEAKRGTVVNVSSMAAEFALPYMAPYNTAKAAVSALTLSLQMEYPQLRFIDLRPGDIKTGFAESWKIQPAQKWSATAARLREMIEIAPGPQVVVDTLLRALKNGRRGTVRAGEFFQTVLAPLGTRLLPARWLAKLQEAYLKR